MHSDASCRPSFEEIDRRIRALDVQGITSQALRAAKTHKLHSRNASTVYIYIYACVYVCMCACVCIYIYIYTGRIRCIGVMQARYVYMHIHMLDA